MSVMEPTMHQEHFRIRSDTNSADGGTPTWEGTEDQAAVHVIASDTTLRIRYVVSNDGSASHQDDRVLYYRIDTGGGYGSWAIVTSSTPIQSSTAASSSTDGQTLGTANYLLSAGTGTVNAGSYDDNALNTTSLPNGRYKEFEWGLSIDSAQVANGDLIQVREYSEGGGTPISYLDMTLPGTYDFTPTIEVDEADPNTSQLPRAILSITKDVDSLHRNHRAVTDDGLPLLVASGQYVQGNLVADSVNVIVGITQGKILEGDVIIAIGHTDTATDNWGTVPTGFTEDYLNEDPASIGSTYQVWSKVAGASEPSSYTWIKNGASVEAGVSIRAYRNVDKGVIYDVAPIAGNSATGDGSVTADTVPTTATSITTSNDDSLAIAVATGHNCIDTGGVSMDVTSYTAAWDLPVSNYQVSQPDNFALWTIEQPKATAGATGAADFTFDITGGPNYFDRFHTIQFALNLIQPGELSQLPSKTLTITPYAPVAAADIFKRDTFTVGSDTALNVHTSDIGGGWQGADITDFTVVAATDDLQNDTTTQSGAAGDEDPNSPNYTVELEGTLGSTAGNIIGVVARGQDGASFDALGAGGSDSYQAWVDRGGGWSLRRIVNGLPTTISFNSLWITQEGLDDDDPIRIRLTLETVGVLVNLILELDYDKDGAGFSGYTTVSSPSDGNANRVLPPGNAGIYLTGTGTKPRITYFNAYGNGDGIIPQWSKLPSAALTLTAFAPSAVTSEANNEFVNMASQALALTAFAPSAVTTENNISLLASAAMALTAFAPSAETFDPNISELTSQALTVTAFAPDAVTSNNNFSQLPGATLTITPYDPQAVTTENNRADLPSATLTITGFAPSAITTEHHFSQLDSAALTLTAFAPNATVAANNFSELASAALTLTAFTPQAITTENDNSQLASAALTLTAFAPSVITTEHNYSQLPSGSLTLTAFAPNAAVAANNTSQLPSQALTLTAFTPQAITTEHHFSQLDSAALTLTAYAPTTETFDPDTSQLASATLTIAGFAPQGVTTEKHISQLPSQALTLTAFAPSVIATEHNYSQLASASLTLTAYAPLVVIPDLSKRLFIVT